MSSPTFQASVKQAAISLSRREVLLGLVAVTLPLPVSATPAEVANAIEETFGETPIADSDEITLELPPLAESGNSVPLTVKVASPMTADDRISRLALFAEANPRPKICEIAFGPAAAEAQITTNIRLSSTQTVVCIAEKADGSLISARHEVRVAVGACTTLPGRY